MKKKKSGFTLVEMIIALSLTVVVLGLIYNIFTTGNKVFSDSDVKSTLQMEAKDIQEKISNIGMQGIEVIPGGSNSVIIKSYVKEDDTPRYFKIKKDRNKLMINEDIDISCSSVDNNQIISENLKSLTINYNQDKSINFNIILSKKKGYSDVTYPINFTIAFRNNN